MKILAIEGSATVASVAIYDDGAIIADYSIEYKKTHSQTLMPMIDTVLTVTETELEMIDAIAVAKGPGSFTGLRIAASTAKGLGMAMDKPIVGVSTLEAMAVAGSMCQGLICPMMDARRGNVYGAIFKCEDGRLTRISEDELISVEDLAIKLRGLNDDIIFVGDGTDTCREKLKGFLEGFAGRLTWASACFNRQRASYVAMLGAEYLKRGETVSAEDFLPDYLRASQAEREMAEKLGK